MPDPKVLGAAAVQMDEFVHVGNVANALGVAVENECVARLEVAAASPRLVGPLSVSGPNDCAPAPKVVIVSASVGAGHDGAAREWAGRLAAAGFEVEISDLLVVFPATLGRRLRVWYEAMLRRAPWVYTLMYPLVAHRRLGPPFVRRVYGHYRKLLAALVDPSTVAVISTHPIVSQVLGTLRERGELRVPAITFLTDFSVHPLWITKGIDAHFALHEIAAGQARALGARNVVVTGPVVPDRFRSATVSRADARSRFGLPATERLALLVAGSWGVGQVEEAARDVAASGAVQPVVVCGRNTELLERLTDRGVGHPLGWIDDMPALLRAVDVVVENAGGLTSLEAMACGIPVATYRPIPGHGRANAAALEEAGVSTWIREQAVLRPGLTELVEGARGRRQRQQMQALFTREPVREALAVVARCPLSPIRPAPTTVWLRRAAVAAIACGLIGLSGTFGTEVAVAKGFTAAHPSGSNKTFVVVDPASDTRIDPGAIRLLRAMHAGVAVDDSFETQQPATVRALSAAGIVILRAGGGAPYRTGWFHGDSGIDRSAQMTTELAGEHPRFYLRSGSLDALDVFRVRRSGAEFVSPNLLVESSGQTPPLRKGQIVLLQCPVHTDCNLPAVLRRLRDQPVTFGSLAELRR